MHTRLLLLIGFVFNGCLSASLFKKITNFDGNETPLIAFVAKQGYKIEKYKVETEDGYILTYHRIWPTKMKKEDRTGYPVLLQHGLGTSSAAFLIPDKNALAYVLAEAGYDVWLGNSRGNRYSPLHTNKNSTNNKLLNSSFHVLGTLDLAAGVNRVLLVTGRENLALLAHSHGVAMALILAASRPSYQSKINVLLALAPAVFLGPGHLRPAEAYRMFISRSIKRSDVSNNVSALSQFPPGLEGKVCKKNQRCLKKLGLLRGTIEPKAWSIIQHFQPAGTSSANLQEILQQIHNGPLFKRFDYGPLENVKIYKSISPPVYDLSKVHIPVHVYFATNDVFITTQDVKTLEAALPNVTLHAVDNLKFNHFDFLWGPNAKSLVYDNVKSVLKVYSGYQTKPLKSTFEKTFDKKLILATEKFLRHLELLYKIKENVWHSGSLISSHDNEIASRKNNRHSVTISTKKTIDNNVIQNLYDELKRLTQHATYLKTKYNVKIKITKYKTIEITNFDNLWKPVFINNDCDKTCRNIFGNLKRLKQSLEFVFNQPFFEVFSPKHVIETNHEFFKYNLISLFKKSNDKFITDLSSRSVKHAIEGLMNTISEARVLVIAVFDIYNLFSKLSAHKKYLYQQFNVQIVGNVSIGLEIANFNKFIKSPRFTTNHCKFQCKDVRLLKDHFSKYSRILSTNIINIDNPSSYIGLNVWSTLMGAKSMYSRVSTINGMSVEQINDLRVMLSNFMKKNSIEITNHNVKKLLQSTGYTDLQKELFKNTILKVFETLRKLTMLKKYIGSEYEVTIVDFTDQQVSIDNFKKLWYNVFGSTEQCSEECSQIKKYLENMRVFKDLSIQRLIIDNPQTYSNTDSGELLDLKLPDIVTSEPQEITQVGVVDNLMDRLTAYLNHIHRTYNIKGKLLHSVESDEKNINRFIHKLNASKEQIYSNFKSKVTDDISTSEDIDDIMKQLMKYQIHIRSKYGLEGGLSSANKDVSNIDTYLKQLNGTKEKFSSGDTEENVVLMKKVCRFQKHLESTYFNNTYTIPYLSCDYLNSKLSEHTKKNNNQSYKILDIERIQPTIVKHHDHDVLWILFNNGDNELVNLTRNAIEQLFTHFETSENQSKVYTKAIYEIYEAFHELWLKKAYLKSTYNIEVTKTELSRISIDNFSYLWNQIYDQNKKCHEQCKQIQSILDTVRNYRYFLTKRTVVDDPQYYLDKRDGKLLNRTSNANIANDHTLNHAEYMDYFISKLQRYQLHIQSLYGLGDSKPAKKDIGDIEKLLKQINETISKCSGNCGENQMLIQNVCRFQKHLEATYFNNTTSTGSEINCSTVVPESNKVNHEESRFRSFNFNKTEILNDVGVTEKRKTDYIKNKLNKYLKHLNNTYGMTVNSTSVTKDVHEIKEILKEFDEKNNTCKRPCMISESNNNRINRFLKHLHETYFHKKSVVNFDIADTDSFTNINAPFQKDLDKLFHSNKDKQFLDLTSNAVKRIVSEFVLNDKIIKLYTLVLHEIYKALHKLTFYKLYLSLAYNVSIISTGNLKITVKRINNLWNDKYHDESMCNQTCTKVKSIIKILRKYKDYLRSNRIEIDNPEVYLDIGTVKNIERNKLKDSFSTFSTIYTSDLLPMLDKSQVVSQREKTSKMFKQNSPANVKSGSLVQPMANEPISNTQVWLMFHGDVEQQGTNLTNEAINKVLANPSLSSAEKKHYMNIVVLIYKTLKKLTAYKSFLDHEYKLNICENDHSTIKVNDFKLFLNDLYNSTNICTGKCIEVRQTVDSIIHYLYLINTTNINIDDPFKNLNKTHWNTLMDKRIIGNDANQVVISDQMIADKAMSENVPSKTNESHNNKNFTFNIDKLERYLKHTESLFNSKELEKQPGFDSLYSLVNKIKEHNEQCAENCAYIENLITQAKTIQEHLNETYFNKNNNKYLDIENHTKEVSKDALSSLLLPNPFIIIIEKKLQEYLNHIKSTYTSGSKSSKTETYINKLNKLLQDINSIKQRNTNITSVKAQSLLKRVEEFQRHLSQAYYSNASLETKINQGGKVFTIPLKSNVKVTKDQKYSQRSNFVNSSDNITNQLNKITINLNKYLNHIKSTYNIGSRDTHSSIEIRKINELLRDINKANQNCTGECIESKDLLRRAEQFQTHLSQTYYSNKTLKTIPDRRGQVNHEHVQTDEPINSMVNNSNVPNQPIKRLNIWLPSFYINGSKHRIDLSGDQVKNLINKENSLIGVKIPQYLDTVYEIYKTLFLLESYKDYLRNYNVHITRTSQSRLSVQNIKNIFEIISENKQCLDKCNEIKYVIKNFDKLKNIFLDNTYIQIDDPISYIDRETSTAQTSVDNSKGVLNLNSTYMHSVDDNIGILKVYLIQLNKLNNIFVHSNRTQDVQRIKILLERLNKLKEQDNSNSNEVDQLHFKVQQLISYLNETYEPYFDQENVSRHNQTYKLELHNSPALNANSNLWKVFKGNENSQVIDLTESSIREKLESLGNEDNDKSTLKMHLYEIYKNFQNLLVYKDYLRSNTNIGISTNEDNKIELTNFNNIFSLFNKTSTFCPDVCKDVRLSLETLIKYMQILNVSTLKIDNPVTYLNTHTGVTKQNRRQNTSSMSDLSKITVRLNKFLSHIKSTYKMDSTDSQSAMDIRKINELLKDINKVKQKCTGDCTESKDLLRRVEQFQTHLSQTYYSNQMFDTKPDQRNIAKHDHVQIDKPINSVIIDSNAPNQPISNFNMWLPSFYINRSKHRIDLSGDRVEQVFNNEKPESGVKIQQDLDIVYEIYKTLLPLETHKNYLQRNYNVHITKTPQSRLIVQNISNIFEIISKNKQCSKKCNEIKNVVNILEKFKDIFVDNTYFQIDDPKAYADRITGTTALTSNKNSKGEVNLKSSFVHSVYDNIRILKVYLVRLNKLNNILLHSNRTRDVQRIKILLEKLNKLKEQDNSNGNEVYQLHFKVQQLISYLNETYEPYFDQENVSRHNQTYKLELHNSPALNANSNLWKVFKGNENSQVIDLTESSIREKLESLGNEDNDKSTLKMHLYEIYKILQNLLVYKDYLRSNTNICISTNEDNKIELTNFNDIFSLFNKTSTFCSDVCKDVRLSLETLIKYKQILNVSTLKIDNPVTYLSTYTSFTGQKIRLNTSNLSDFSEITKRLNKYLNHIKSTYNIGSKDSQSATDIRKINELLLDINKVKQKCTGDCTESKDLLKRVEQFHTHLSQTYSPNKTLETKRKSRVLGNHFFNATHTDVTFNVHRPDLKPIYNQTVFEDEKINSELIKITSGTNPHKYYDEQQYDSDLLSNVKKYKDHINSTYNVF